MVHITSALAVRIFRSTPSSRMMPAAASFACRVAKAFAFAPRGRKRNPRGLGRGPRTCSRFFSALPPSGMMYASTTRVARTRTPALLSGRWSCRRQTSSFPVDASGRGFKFARRRPGRREATTRRREMTRGGLGRARRCARHCVPPRPRPHAPAHSPTRWRSGRLAGVGVQEGLMPRPTLPCPRPGRRAGRRPCRRRRS